MNVKRRQFLKQTGLAGAVAVAAAGAFRPSGADAATAGGGARPESPVMPKGMTLLTMQSGGVYSLGVKTGRGIVDVRRAARVLKSSAPTTMDQLIAGGDQGLTDLVSRALAAPSGGGLVRDEGKLAFGPCVTNPEKIVCVGLNYARHAKEVGQPLPKMPILFNKFNNSLNAHQGVVRVSSIPAEKFDYEAELVIVMGRKATNVSEAEALSYVFGYATGNDFTARDLQSRSSQWMIGKSCDGFGLIGPYIVTADQVDPGNLKIEGTVNGEVRQSSNTNDLVFNCAQIISYASKLMTLQPGDLIYTGTPEGVISGYPKEKQIWLKPGDRLTTTIEKLGELRFTLV
jgi:2-keto-4-pentenoate hydratase/2-oxohepta-3-ene-1,7-dioic acid hydratase in catechol pathway